MVETRQIWDYRAESSSETSSILCLTTWRRILNTPNNTNVTEYSSKKINVFVPHSEDLQSHLIPAVLTRISRARFSSCTHVLIVSSINILFNFYSQLYNIKIILSKYAHIKIAAHNLPANHKCKHKHKELKIKQNLSYNNKQLKLETCHINTQNAPSWQNTSIWTSIE
jgi:ABC-type uncharacterized transport system permease subunit